MWLITTQGFYSVVESAQDPNVLRVRCRCREDMLALRRQIPDLVPQEQLDPARDYAWFAYVNRRAWRRALVMLAEDIDYGNFKDAVTNRQGEKRHAVYLRVWGVLLSLESRRRRRAPRRARARP